MRSGYAQTSTAHTDADTTATGCTRDNTEEDLGRVRRMALLDLSALSRRLQEKANQPVFANATPGTVDVSDIDKQNKPRRKHHISERIDARNRGKGRWR